MTGQIHPAMTFDEYVAIDALNWSQLKVMAKSPAHYQWAQFVTPEDTDHLRLGRAIHTSILEPRTFEARFCRWPGPGRRSGKEWEAFESTAKRAGKEVLLPHHDDAVKQATFSARSNPHVMRLLGGAKTEVTITWETEVPAVGDLPGRKWLCKSRLDGIKSTAIVDLKSAKSGNPADFARDAWNLNYLGQAAFYVDAVVAATGSAPPFYFLVIEKTPPYVVTPLLVPDDLIERGREQYKNLLARLAMCERLNSWPGYVDGIGTLELPAWVARSEDEDMSDTGINFSGASDGL